MEILQSCLSELEKYINFTLPKFPRLVVDFTRKVNAEEVRIRNSAATLAGKQASTAQARSLISRVRSIGTDGRYGDAYGSYHEAVARYQADHKRLVVLQRNL